MSSTLRNMPWVDVASMAMEATRIFNAGFANGKECDRQFKADLC
jgi:hypothetical protein